MAARRATGRPLASVLPGRGLPGPSQYIGAMIYRWIGKAVVNYGVGFVRRRYGRQLTVVAAVSALGLVAGAAYLANRDVPEG